MSIRITHNAFRTSAEADAGVARAGLIRMELEVPPVENTAHWHDFHAELYVLDGDLYFTDVAEGKIHTCRAGTKIVVPRRSLHAELSRGGYHIIFGTSVPPEEFGEPVNRTPEMLNS
jgi:quercetin dioxygenase-like cupin family protein